MLKKETKISLRPAQAEDFEFTKRVLQETMRELITARIGWNQEIQDKFFAEHFDPTSISIIRADNRDVGWMQVKQSETEWELAQFYVDSPFQNQGIGSQVLAELLAKAQEGNCCVTITAFKASPVVKLYERFGFVVENDDPVHYKFFMRWQPAN